MTTIFMNPSSVTLEIRPGPGGDEAQIWADDLIRMYRRFAENKGWKTKLIDQGFLQIQGNDVYDLLKNEGGVHRVQRVPVTEKRGRIHTSTASVVVLKEVKDNEIAINNADLVWEFYHASSHGGQNVQKVSTAVRLKHKPTNIVVTAQSERFQEQNRANALSLLRSKLWEIEEDRKIKEIGDQRAIAGRAMRNEKIRTYNFLQDRITDHRIGKSWHHLESILEGNLEDMLMELFSSL